MTTLLIVATADNHLSRHHARMSPAKLESRRERLRQAFGAAVNHAIEHGAALFLHGGDLFDTPSPTNADLAYVAACLRRLEDAGVVVVAVGGNHDTPSGRTVQGGVAPIFPLAYLHGLTYFGTPTLERINLEVAGMPLQIAGMTPAPGQNAMDPLEALDSAAGDGIQIFLTHGAIEGHGAGSREPVLRRHSAATLPDLRLVITGHIHRHATERVGDVLLLAPGATEWMTHGEVDAPPGFVTCVWDGECVRDVQHVPVTPQPRVTIDVDMETLDNEPHEDVRALITTRSTAGALTRLRVTGIARREQYENLLLRQLQEYGAERNFHFDVDVTRLRISDNLQAGAVRGVRSSQPEEIAAIAQKFIEASSTEYARVLWQAARDEVLAKYE
jgi:DNA repair exonuclease SbcCD nuclease subunit